MDSELFYYLQTIFLKLLNMSVTASYLVIAVILLRIVLKKVPKNFRCILWALVGIRLLFPFSIESVLSLIPQSTSIPNSTILSQNPSIQNGIDGVNIVLSGTYTPVEGQYMYHAPELSALGTLIWIAGVFLMIVYGIISYIRIKRKVRVSMLLRDNIYLCDNIGSPFILGIIKPRIYLPSDIEETQIDAVLEHENSHLKRFDHLWKPLGFILLTIYCFNPLVWVAYILLCRDIELACDERVIKRLDAESRKKYSEVLLSFSVPRHMIMACPLAFGEVAVKDRIKSVLSYKKPTFWIIAVALVTCLIVTITFMTNPISLKTEVDNNLDSFISDVILSRHSIKEPDNFECESHTILGVETKGDTTTIYAWVLVQEYKLHGNTVLEDSGSHIPTVITVKKTDSTYELVSYEEPSDGSLYGKDIRKMFPLQLWTKAFDSGRYIDAEDAKCKADAEKYFNTISNSTPGNTDNSDNLGTTNNTGNTNNFIADDTGTLKKISHMYSYTESQDIIKPGVVLYDDGTYTFSQGALSSMIYIGYYKFTGKQLFLYANSEATGKPPLFVFHCAGENLLFDADSSQHMPGYSDIYDGARFVPVYNKTN